MFPTNGNSIRFGVSQEIFVMQIRVSMLPQTVEETAQFSRCFFLLLNSIRDVRVYLFLPHQKYDLYFDGQGHSNLGLRFGPFRWDYGNYQSESDWLAFVCVWVFFFFKSNRWNNLCLHQLVGDEIRGKANRISIVLTN